jgi:apolipoprotein N-acyltransferase
MHSKTDISLAMLGGLLLGITRAMPALFFLIFIAWVPLLILEKRLRDRPNPYAAFNYALAGFLLWNVLGTWWVTRPQPVGGILIIAANALVQALVFWSASRIRARLGIPFIFPFVFLWLGYEHFHLSWDLAWPWLNLGNSLAGTPEWIQWYEFTGVRGGSLWILLTNHAVYGIYRLRCRPRLMSTAPMVVLAALLIWAPAWYSFRIYRSPEPEADTVEIALIQPNLDPYTEKFSPDLYAGHLEAFYRRAEAIVDERTDYLFGPETLIVEQIDEEAPLSSPYFRQLTAFWKNHPELNILIGVHSYRKLDDGNVPPGSRFDEKGEYYYEAFNTALFLTPGSAPQFYHKTKLVPLFERMPFVQYLRFLGKYSLELGGYTGTYSNRQESTVFTVADGSTKILPILCFESIFGPYCARDLPAEKSFIVMITNDGWWKNTPGYRHHFSFSPVRAIETRRDLVRVANTGVSAIINHKGEVVAKTPWWEEATLKGQVRLRSGRTFFARHGDFIGRICLVAGVGFLLVAAIRKWIPLTR